MLKKLLLLISSFLIASSAVSEESEFGMNYSGFIYNTTFSDNSFHDNRTILAINADIDYKKFAFRTQLSNHDSLHIRRAVLEFSNNLGEKIEYTYQVGRFSRVNSFYNAVLNPPSDYQMAILPFAGYSYRMFNGSFVLMDGHNFMTTYKLESGNLLRARIATGKAVINDQIDVQKEVYRSYDPNLSIESDRNNFDYGLYYETRDWNLFYSRNEYSILTETESNLKPYKMFKSMFRNIEYDLEKYGVKFDNREWVVSAEYGKGIVKSVNEGGFKTTQSVSEDYHFIIGKRFIERLYLYSGYSVGFNYTSKSKNDDAFVGCTYNFEKVVVSVEYHEGEGKSWVKYSERDIEKKWNSWVISTSYRF